MFSSHTKLPVCSKSTSIQYLPHNDVGKLAFCDFLPMAATNIARVYRLR